MTERATHPFEYLAIFKRRKQWFIVTFVLCTAAVQTVEPMRANLAAQQIRIVYKPFDIDQLLAEIDAAVLGLAIEVIEPGID